MPVPQENWGFVQQASCLFLIFNNRQDACSTRRLIIGGTGILPVPSCSATTNCYLLGLGEILFCEIAKCYFHSRSQLYRPRQTHFPESCWPAGFPAPAGWHVLRDERRKPGRNQDL